MAKNKDSATIDSSTEEKIKEAARLVFTQKGYAATKVRDIAAEADINLSLVNYYFRSKEKLFELIMAETVQKLFDKVLPVANNEQTSVIEKIGLIAEQYIDLLLENPDFPLFIVSEVMSGSNKLPQMVNNGQLFLSSHFAKQLIALRQEGKIDFHPLQLMMNILGMIIFPFLARPIMLRSGALKAEEFRSIVEERKRLIPHWIDQIITP
jgi:AcrR family transcriptional regulator